MKNRTYFYLGGVCAKAKYYGTGCLRPDWGVYFSLCIWSYTADC